MRNKKVKKLRKKFITMLGQGIKTVEEAEKFLAEKTTGGVFGRFKPEMKPFIKGAFRRFKRLEG